MDDGRDAAASVGGGVGGIIFLRVVSVGDEDGGEVDTAALPEDKGACGRPTAAGVPDAEIVGSGGNLSR